MAIDAFFSVKKKTGQIMLIPSLHLQHATFALFMLATCTVYFVLFWPINHFFHSLSRRGFSARQTFSASWKGKAS
jgi:hypothetical protein